MIEWSLSWSFHSCYALSHMDDCLTDNSRVPQEYTETNDDDDIIISFPTSTIVWPKKFQSDLYIWLYKKQDQTSMWPHILHKLRQEISRAKFLMYALPKPNFLIIFVRKISQKNKLNHWKTRLKNYCYLFICLVQCKAHGARILGRAQASSISFLFTGRPWHAVRRHRYSVTLKKRSAPRHRIVTQNFDPWLKPTFITSQAVLHKLGSQAVIARADKPNLV